jgi:TRAP transporter TAXI family solute receptor
MLASADWDAAAQPRDQALAQQYGYSVKRPIIGGACPTCPWGAIATIVRTAMEPAGWNVQQCYTCSMENSVRIVAGAQRPPPPRYDRSLPASPDGPVDLGVTSLAILESGYNGRAPYNVDGPFRNLRAIARIEHPQYLMVAARRETFITDLSQIRERRIPVRILTDGREPARSVLEHYNIREEDLRAWGGALVRPDARDAFDVIIFRGYLGNSPESDIIYETTQKFDLRFLDLAEPLLARLARDFTDLERVTLPIGYVRGVDRAIPTVARSGQVIYGRTDMPDEFAYALARTLDQNRRAFQWSHLQFHYDSNTVWRTQGVPLHPAAERYYRERGYMR